MSESDRINTAAMLGNMRNGADQYVNVVAIRNANSKRALENAVRSYYYRWLTCMGLTSHGRGDVLAVSRALPDIKAAVRVLCPDKFWPAAEAELNSVVGRLRNRRLGSMSKDRRTSWSQGVYIRFGD